MDKQRHTCNAACITLFLLFAGPRPLTFGQFIEAYPTSMHLPGAPASLRGQVFRGWLRLHPALLARLSSLTHYNVLEAWAAVDNSGEYKRSVVEAVKEAGLSPVSADNDFWAFALAHKSIHSLIARGRPQEDLTAGSEIFKYFSTSEVLGPYYVSPAILGGIKKQFLADLAAARASFKTQGFENRQRGPGRERQIWSLIRYLVYNLTHEEIADELQYIVQHCPKTDLPRGFIQGARLKKGETTFEPSSVGRDVAVLARDLGLTLPSGRRNHA